MDKIEVESAPPEGLVDTPVDAPDDAPEAEPAHWKLKVELMDRILEYAKRSGWSQSEAARQCRVHQPRMNDLYRRKIENFSLDALIKLAASLGFKVSLEIEDP